MRVPQLLAMRNRILLDTAFDVSICFPVLVCEKRERGQFSGSGVLQSRGQEEPLPCSSGPTLASGELAEKQTVKVEGELCGKVKEEQPHTGSQWLVPVLLPDRAQIHLAIVEPGQEEEEEEEAAGQLSSCPQAQLSAGCPVAQLSDCSSEQLSGCLPAHLSAGFPVAQLSGCPLTQLPGCPPAQLSVCHSEQLSSCSPVKYFSEVQEEETEFELFDSDADSSNGLSPGEQLDLVLRCQNTVFSRYRR